MSTLFRCCFLLCHLFSLETNWKNDLQIFSTEHTYISFRVLNQKNIVAQHISHQALTSFSVITAIIWSNSHGICNCVIFHFVKFLWRFWHYCLSYCRPGLTVYTVWSLIVLKDRKREIQWNQNKQQVRGSRRLRRMNMEEVLTRTQRRCSRLQPLFYRLWVSSLLTSCFCRCVGNFISNLQHLTPSKDPNTWY